MITQALFVSEPVPAVVGTAITGAVAGADAALHFLDRAGVGIQQRNGLAAVHGRTAADQMTHASPSSASIAAPASTFLSVGSASTPSKTSIRMFDARRASSTGSSTPRRQILVGHDQRGGLAERLDVVCERLRAA